MTETQKIWDSKMHVTQSFNYCNRKSKNKINKIKRVKDIIQDLERHGPAGIIHIGILSDIIKKPIKIWYRNLNITIGRGQTEIDIEYHATDSEQIGHWTLKYGKDPGKDTSIDLNSCLFSVIGSQIGRSPSELRKWTVLNLTNNCRKLANRIDKILRLEKNGKINLMIGGARYCGTSPSHARVILDNSQNQRCHGFSNTGHPRGHASHPSGDNVENYSRQSKGIKTAFLSRTDQDYMIHLALRTRKAQDAMNLLNGGQETVYVKVNIGELNNSRNNWPKAREYLQGEPIAEGDIGNVAMLLRHHQGQYNNPDADVFVHTCYPIIQNSIPLK